MTLSLPLSSVDAVFGAVKDEGHSQPCQQLLSGRPHLYMSSHAEQLHHGNPTGWQHVHQSPWPGNDLHILWPQVGVCWPWNCPLSDLWKVCLSVISLAHTYQKESLYCSASLPKPRSFHVIKVKLHSPRSPKNLNEAYQTLKYFFKTKMWKKNELRNNIHISDYVIRTRAFWWYRWSIYFQNDRHLFKGCHLNWDILYQFLLQSVKAIYY